MTTVSKARVVLTGSFLWSIVLTGCASQSSYDTLKVENDQLRQQVAAQSAQITRLQGVIKYTVESDLLFAPGSWELSEQGKETISKLAPKLAPTQRNTLVVIGHTDNEPIGPTLERQGVTSNLVLSQKRAEAVRQFLISQGVRPDLVTAVGHGEIEPVATNDTAQGRSQNRRVELSLQG